MVVLTWNLLHRVHAMNWGDEPVRAHPVERERAAAIAERIAGFLEDVDVVALQEVSGDQLACLRALLAGEVVCHHHRYPRVPRVRSGAPAGLDDPSEHLVVVAREGRVHVAETFPTDPGKGLLAVEVGGRTVVATHVSFGPRRETQLARLRGVAPDAIVLGDFNAEAAVVSAAFPGAMLSSRVAPCSTRVGKADAIDHVVAPKILSAEVLDGAGLSDHHPVRAACL